MDNLTFNDDKKEKYFESAIIFNRFHLPQIYLQKNNITQIIITLFDSLYLNIISFIIISTPFPFIIWATVTDNGSIIIDGKEIYDGYKQRKVI